MQKAPPCGGALVLSIWELAARLKADSQILRAKNALRMTAAGSDAR
jgi:hypothetical protein